MQMVRIAREHEARRHLDVDLRRSAIQRLIRRFRQHHPQADGLQLGRARRRLAIVQRGRRQLDCAFQCPLQARRRAFHTRVIGFRQHIRDQLRRSQRVAKVMVDLGHRAAKLGKVGALPERVCDRFFHARQGILCTADLVPAGRRRQPPRPAARIAAELFHADRHTLDRPHDKHVQNGIDQDCRDQRDDQRQACDPPGKLDQARLQRRLRQQDFEHPAFRGAFGDHDQDFALRGQVLPQRGEGAPHGGRAPEVDEAHGSVNCHARRQKLDVHLVFDLGDRQHLGLHQQAL